MSDISNHFNSWTLGNFFILFLHVLLLGDVEPVFYNRIFYLNLTGLSYFFLFMGHYWWLVFLASLAFGFFVFKKKNLQKVTIQVPIMIGLVLLFIIYLLGFYLPILGSSV